MDNIKNCVFNSKVINNTWFTRNIFWAIFLLGGSSNLIAQNCKLCKAVEKNNMHQVEKIIRHRILAQKHGDEINNGSNTYTSYNKVYDELVNWLNQKECVQLAAWDKCQVKILPYPSYAAIGVVFNTPHADTEVVFHIRQGHTSRIKNWVNTRDRLYYLGMKKSEGFVKNQLALCEEKENRLIETHSVPISDSIRKVHASDPDILFALDTISYSDLLGKYVNIDNQEDTILFTEIGKPVDLIKMHRGPVKDGIQYAFRVVSNGKIENIGTYNPWRIDIVRIRVVENGELQVHYSCSYSFEDEAVKKHTYRKL